MLDLRQLRYFTTIADQRSFTRAAEVLNVAQPALSLHVRHMEADLGVALLVRSSRGVELTESGMILLRHARAILGQLAAAEEEIRGQAADPAGEVRLGLPATICEVIAVPLIREVHQRHPKIRLRLAEAMSGYVQDWLREGRLDLAILYNDIADTRIASRTLLQEELVLFASPTLAAGTGLPPPGTPIARSLAFDMPLILPAESHSLRRLLADQALAAGRSLTTVFDVDSYTNIKALVAQDLGFSILPRRAIGAAVDQGQLVFWPVSDPPLMRTIHLSTRKDRPQTNAVAAVERLTHGLLTSLVTSGAWIGTRLSAQD